MPAVLMPLALASAHAAGKSCDELAAEIADKIRAGGVSRFELEIVPAKLVSGDKVVGTCEQGAKKITYVRLPGRTAPPPPPSPTASAPRKP